MLGEGSLTSAAVFGIIALVVFVLLVRGMLRTYRGEEGEAVKSERAPKASAEVKTVTATPTKPEPVTASVAEQVKPEAEKSEGAAIAGVSRSVSRPAVRVQGPKEEDDERINYVESVLAKYVSDTGSQGT